MSKRHMVLGALLKYYTLKFWTSENARLEELQISGGDRDICDLVWNILKIKFKVDILLFHHNYFEFNYNANF